MLILLWVGSSSLGCGQRTVDRNRQVAPTGIVWIVIDTLRADHLSCYGGEVSTPNIDSLARRGVRFNRAYSPIPITGPSHASMFTGVWPDRHGVRNNTHVLPEEATTIAEVLQRAGVQTAAVVSLGNLQRRFGFAQGFNRFDDHFPMQWFRPAREITDGALDALEALEPGRFFLFVHFSDPHEPYASPGDDYPVVRVGVNGESQGEVEADGCLKRFRISFRPGRSVITFEAVDRVSGRPFLFRHLKLDEDSLRMEYTSGWEHQPPGLPNTYRIAGTSSQVVVTNPGDASLQSTMTMFIEESIDLPTARIRYGREVEYVDREIGRLLEHLRARADSEKIMVVLTSDHGEGLGDHDLLGHVHQLYDSLTRVPLIVVDDLGAFDEEDLTRDDLVSVADIAPTVADFFQLNMGDDIDGLMLPIVHGGTGADPARTLPLMTFAPEAREDLFGTVGPRFKFIWRPQDDRRELFDLARDPGELLDLVAEAARLKDELTSAMADRAEEETVEGVPEALTPEERAHLEILGYVH